TGKCFPFVFRTVFSPVFATDVCCTSPLIHRSFCPDKPIPAGFLGSFAACPVSALAGLYDDEGVIYLRQRVVNVIQSGCRVVSQKRTGYCWPTPQYRNWCAQHAFFEGKKAG